MVDLYDIVVGSSEGSFEHAFERLGYASNLSAVGVLNVEVPGPPVLSVDRPDLGTARDQAKANLAECVLLLNLTDRVAGTVFDNDP